LRSAERIAFSPIEGEAGGCDGVFRMRYGDVKTRIRHCSVCFNNLTEGRPVRDFATDPIAGIRDWCGVVEQPKDLLSLESAGLYKGVYHVLAWPDRRRWMDIRAEGFGRLTALMNRLASGKVREVIMGDETRPMEGDGTALAHSDGDVSRFPGRGRWTRLARGLPAGSSIEYAPIGISWRKRSAGGRGL